jgi:CMP/dCMP kinase
MIITIDGPTASGKSTLARQLAEKLHYYYLNTGLLYRALAYLLLENKKYTYDMLTSPKMEDVREFVDADRLRYTYGYTAHITFDGSDITGYLKDAYLDRATSLVSGVGIVRELLLDFQRVLAQKNNIVAEGRDTGSVVFADADYKFYLTADVVVRARRWQEMQQVRGNNITHEESVKSIIERDDRDSKRTIAPLVIPQGATVIDNSLMSQEETLDAFLQVI